MPLPNLSTITTAINAERFLWVLPHDAANYLRRHKGNFSHHHSWIVPFCQLYAFSATRVTSAVPWLIVLCPQLPSKNLIKDLCGRESLKAARLLKACLDPIFCVQSLSRLLQPPLVSGAIALLLLLSSTARLVASFLAIWDRTLSFGAGGRRITIKSVRPAIKQERW